MASIIYLAKLGELTLKGSNRADFERRLVANTRRALVGAGASVRLQAGRLYVEADEGASPAAEAALAHLVGITGWAKARACDKSLGAIREAVYGEALDAKVEGARTFKIEARRADKGFPLDSYGIQREAPLLVCERNLLAVDVHRPDAVITVEVRDRAFVYRNAHKGCRGLPAGTGGKGLLLLSGGIDSPVAGYRMIRRGMRLDAAYFHAFPYTPDEAQRKVEDIAAVLARFGMSLRLHAVSFTAVQLRIKERAPEAYRTLLLRYCMIQAANLLAERTGAQCLVSGESLGQVASQTLENMTVTESAARFPLLRPLVGLDKEEIIETAKAIGTYGISILPYEDCCTLFSPKHPVLRARAGETRSLYEALDADALIAEACETCEARRFPVQESRVARADKVRVP